MNRDRNKEVTGSVRLKKNIGDKVESEELNSFTHVEPRRDG